MEEAKLYVANIAFDATDADLRRFFERAGQVVGARIVMDRDQNISRGFGFVEMADESGLRAALRLDGVAFMGRKVMVQKARPRDQASKR